MDNYPDFSKPYPAEFYNNFRNLTEPHLWRTINRDDLDFRKASSTQISYHIYGLKLFKDDLKLFQLFLNNFHIRTVLDQLKTPDKLKQLSQMVRIIIQTSEGH